MPFFRINSFEEPIAIFTPMLGRLKVLFQGILSIEMSVTENTNCHLRS